MRDPYLNFEKVPNSKIKQALELQSLESTEYTPPSPTHAIQESMILEQDDGYVGFQGIWVVGKIYEWGREWEKGESMWEKR